MDYLIRLYEGRINRKNYLAGTIAYIVVFFLVYIFLGITGILDLYLIYWLLVIIFIFFSYSLIVRRLHDTGNSGWIALFALVPLVNCLLGLWLLFKQGDLQNNKYGEMPPQVSRFPHDILKLRR